MPEIRGAGVRIPDFGLFSTIDSMSQDYFRNHILARYRVCVVELDRRPVKTEKLGFSPARERAACVVPLV